MGYGPIGRVALVVLAVLGFLLALGDVLDFYDASWKISVPLTLVYAALIWRFALRPAKGEPPPTPAWPLGLDIILGKLAATAAVLLITLGAVALTWDLIGLIRDNWHYVVIAAVLLAVIVGWAMLAGRKTSD